MKIKNYLLIVCALFLGSLTSQAQNSQTQKGLLWEISGKKLSKPSYIYGTFHLLNEDYVNSLKGWKEKFDKCDVVVGEVIMDSSKMQGVIASMIMKDNTLDKLLTPEEYKKTGEFLKEVNGMDIAMFNSFKPMALSTLLTLFVWAKENPIDYNPQKPAMDTYFQKLGKEAKKELNALESMEDQTTVLFDIIDLKRQAEMLVAMVLDKDKTLQEMRKMDKCYKEQDLSCIMETFYSKECGFKEKELNILVNDRNKAWIPQLMTIIDNAPAFIAVGAGHLPGKEGILNLLKEKGYTIKQVELK